MATKKGVDPLFVAEVLVRGLVEVPVGGKTLAEALEDAKTIRLGDVFPAQGELVDGNLEITGVRDQASWSKAGL